MTDAASARRVLLENASIIKRPVVEWGESRESGKSGKTATVGFDPGEWKSRLSGP